MNVYYGKTLWNVSYTIINGKPLHHGLFVIISDCIQCWCVTVFHEVYYRFSQFVQMKHTLNTLIIYSISLSFLIITDTGETLWLIKSNKYITYKCFEVFYYSYLCISIVYFIQGLIALYFNVLKQVHFEYNLLKSWSLFCSVWNHSLVHLFTIPI